MTRSATRRATALAFGVLLAVPLALACAHPGRVPSTGAGQEGLASYYSKSLAGRQTASGERYDPSALTAAHRTLPFGTVVRVERVGQSGRGTGSAVVVRINDRGPFVRGRIIDLSGAAADELGMRTEGVVPVRVSVLEAPRSSR